MDFSCPEPVEPGPNIRGRLFDRVGHQSPNVVDLLSRREQDELRRIAKRVDYPLPQTTIFSRGAEAQFVYLICEGIVRVVRVAPNGQRRILAFRVPGDLFGIPDCGVYANSSETVSPVKLYRLPWIALRHLMANEPQFQLNLLMKLAHDFRQAQRQMMILGQQNAKQRLASFILDFMRNPAFFEQEQSMLSLPISRSDLADYLGTTRETTTRALIGLERQGLLQRVNSHAIKIVDPKGLKRLQHGSSRPRTDLRSRATSP